MNNLWPFFLKEGGRMESMDRILRKPELVAKVGLSDPSIYRREKKGDFPKRITLGGHSVGWLESEVNDWLARKAAERK
jgi:prophage regulatory protein